MSGKNNCSDEVIAFVNLIDAESGFSSCLEYLMVTNETTDV